MLASHESEQVKAGLQRACEIIEGGQAFLSYGFLKIGLAAHLQSPELRVRRWAYKLVALLKDDGYLDQLEAALLGFEGDPENRGWASAAFSGLADESRKSRVISRLDDYTGTSLELAAKLYARGEPARDELNLQVWISEPLARKWLCLLCGYARTHTRTIDQRFGDLDLVRNSVGDSDVEVVEYAIWAEHRHPDGSFRGLLRRPDELLAHSNVRRWLYRLLTKDADAALSNLDLLTERMDPAREPSEVAREGLALGLARLQLDERRDETIEWFIHEVSPRVRLALVDHLALLANRHLDSTAREVLVAAYSRAGPADLLGAKILSVAKPDWGLASLRLATSAGDLVIPRPMPIAAANGLFAGATINLFYKQENDMSTTNITQSGSGNSMAGIAGGDIIASTISAVQQQPEQGVRDLAPLLDAFLKALNASGVDQSDKELAIRAADEAARATGDDRKGKWQMLKGVVRGMLQLPGLAAGAVEGGEKLVHAIQGAMG